MIIEFKGLFPFMLLAVNGFFTGLGVVFANWFYDSYLRKHMEKIARAKALALKEEAKK